MPYRKYLLLLGIIGAFFAIAHVTLAADTSFVSMSQFPAFNSSASGGLSGFINSLYKYLIGIAAILAVLEITWGGFLWMGSGASVTSKEAGRNKIMMALTGLLLVLSPVIIFSIINPSVLSLKLGTKAINITQPSQNSDSNQTTFAPSTGCVPAGGGPLLKKYTCAGGTQVSAVEKYCTAPLSQPTLTCSAKNYEGCVKQTLYCSVIKAPLLQAYEFVFNTSPLTIGEKIFFPKSSSTFKTFTKNCTGSGGVVNEVPAYWLKADNTALKNNKPIKNYIAPNYIYNKICNDRKYPTITSIPNNVKGTICFPIKLTCKPATIN